jgi:hypothetical protein
VCLNTHNSFALLDDEEILARALEMGVCPTSFSLENVNYLKDLEIARHNMGVVQNSVVNSNDVDSNPILLLGLSEEQSESDRDIEEEAFTPVLSRRKRRNKKSACKIGRSGTQLTSGDVILGAQSTSSAAQVKARNDHPLCGIIAGTRNRKQNPKYL